MLSLTACLNEPRPDESEAEAPEALTAAQNVKDFLLEDVCLDPAGNATGEDPWTCPERRRNQRMNDPITYLRRTPNPIAGARRSAYPMQGPAGEFRVAFAH